MPLRHPAVCIYIALPAFTRHIIAAMLAFYNLSAIFTFSFCKGDKVFFKGVVSDFCPIINMRLSSAIVFACYCQPCECPVVHFDSVNVFSLFVHLSFGIGIRGYWLKWNFISLTFLWHEFIHTFVYIFRQRADCPYKIFIICFNEIRDFSY